MGGQDEVEATSSGHIEWSCAQDILMITIRDAHRLVECYGLEVSVPSELCRVYKPPRGYVMVSGSFLKFEVQFSLNRFFRDVLRFYGLTVF